MQWQNLKLTKESLGKTTDTQGRSRGGFRGRGSAESPHLQINDIHDDCIAMPYGKIDGRSILEVLYI